MPLIQPGDTLSALARANNTTVAALLAANPQITNPDRIYAGQNINIPSARGNQPATGPTGAQAPAGTTYNPSQLISDVASQVASHPGAQSYLAAGNTPQSILYASTTGDFTGLVNSQGQPFSAADQADAVARATAALNPAFLEGQNYDTTSTENSIAQTQNDFNHYLDTSAADFNTKKATADTTAAQNGVLFSGGRVQQLNNLKNSFDEDQNYNRTKAANTISGLATDYQYKYGNDAAGGLSSYYNLGGQSYNPNVASGGVTSNGLSSIYNPSSNNFYGTARAANKANINVYAAGLLANKGNKLVPYGYNNQF